MSMTISEITDLYLAHGSEQYGGEAVNQLQHALQCASLAENSGATPELICASLLHDLGHLLRLNASSEHNEVAPITDDLHQYLVVPFLRGVFSDAVIEPIKLHVDAKKYLCATNETYWSSLSAASKHSLALQGGPHTTDEAARFIKQPYAEDAVNLRRWDDLAKEPKAIPPEWSHYSNLLDGLKLLTVK
jgi:phosphonate degradation associated HDIG domain protein